MINKKDAPNGLIAVEPIKKDNSFSFCNGCIYFFNERWNGKTCEEEDAHCMKDHRKDGENVIFIKDKK